MGTGPYRIVEFEPEQQLVLERYDDYWGGWEGTTSTASSSASCPRTRRGAS